MNFELEQKSETEYKALRKWVIVISIIIPLAVAGLFGIKIEGIDFSFLPPIYAGINAVTAALLISALVAIKQKNLNWHRIFIHTSLVLSVLFLVAYVAYHMTSESTAYKGDYPILYYSILISHIVLSIVVIPIVLFTYLFAWKGDVVRHKKWTRWAFPIWLYVAVTGVLVYVMISPYYL